MYNIYRDWRTPERRTILGVRELSGELYYCNNIYII
jgi:hypothetical protein